MTDTQTRTLQVISEHAHDMPVDLIKGEYNLSQALGLDPGDTADMVMSLEKEFDIHIGPRDFPHPLSTVSEVVAMVEGIVGRKQALEAQP